MTDSGTGAGGARVDRFQKRRVLVVDDDPTFVLLATEALQQSDFIVKSAGTAQQALEVFATFMPDLVLLDVELPGGNGFDVCRSIRASPTNHDVPVVLVTGHNDTESIEASYEAGATDFMSKPVLWPTLPYRVDFMLRALDDRRGLARSEKRIRALLQALPDASAIVDHRGCITEHLIGSDTRSDRSLVGKTLEESFPPELAAAARRALGAPEANLRATQEFAIGDGAQRRWFEARFRPQTDGTLLIVTRDSTERRNAKARIEYLAYYDVLTRLPNRQRLIAQAAHSIKQATRCSTQVAALHLDLDRFKRVNDNLGHSLGNELLKSVARRLETLVRDAERPSSTQLPVAPRPRMVARLGGDEFVVLVEDLSDDTQAVEIADRIRRLLAEPCECGGHHLVVTPSIGIAVFPRDSRDIDDLLVKADMAMHRAKDQGGNGHAFFGDSLALRSLGRLAMENDMREAFERGGFSIAYQPQLDLASGTIAGVEALLRWEHPRRGAVSPAVFIPLAEETGLIVPLGQWVIARVCEQLKRWADMGLGRLTASVNVSVPQFVRHDFVDSVLGALRAARVEPARLELEITESLLMQNTAHIRTSMDRLRSHGVTLSIDDFGTGYSSLGYLRDLPVSALKIDRSFVRDLDRQDDAAKICAAIIALARELRLRVVAEGVETEGQLAFLRRHRCDQVQGFLISKPVPAADLEVLLERPDVLSAIRASAGKSAYG